MQACDGMGGVIGQGGTLAGSAVGKPRRELEWCAPETLGVLEGWREQGDP